MEYYGIDLDEELASHRYGWLLDRILDIPDPYSRFREAMSEDEEMATLLLEMEESQDEEECRRATLRYSQVGVQERLLMSIDMGIKAMRAEAPHIPHLKAPKGRPKYAEPWPMPVTAVERLKKRREQADAARIAALFGVKPGDMKHE